MSETYAARSGADAAPTRAAAWEPAAAPVRAAAWEPAADRAAEYEAEAG